MDRSLVVVLCLALGAFVGGEAQAKRQGPEPVAPVVREGENYLAPNNSGREGIVEVRKVDTGEKLWEAVIYTVKLDPDLEEDVQWVFITKLEDSDGKLLVANENGE